MKRLGLLFTNQSTNKLLGCALLVGTGLVFQKENIVYSTQQQTYYFKFGHYVIPHPEKAYKGGEDAFYADNTFLAVADGVGGWASHGVDPAKYSKELCSHISELLQKNNKYYENNPKILLHDAALLTTSKGSSTLCIATLDKNQPVLKTAYIGDSGYIIYRPISNDLKLIHKSEEHTHSFNFPFQIGTNGDSPNLALQYEHQVQAGDLVVLGTDGLFDNIDEYQVARIIQKALKEFKQVEGNEKYTLIAQKIAEDAFSYSIDSNYLSPFAKRARELPKYKYYIGGKSDDITVIVAEISKQQLN